MRVEGKAKEERGYLRRTCESDEDTDCWDGREDTNGWPRDKGENTEEKYTIDNTIFKFLRPPTFNLYRCSMKVMRAFF